MTLCKFFELILRENELENFGVAGGLVDEKFVAKWRLGGQDTIK